MGRRALIRSASGVAAASLVLAVALAAPSAASVPRCVPAHLKAWGMGVTAATGTILWQFAFINTSAQECSLIGYPKLQMRSASGQPIATHDQHEPVSGYPEITRKLVILATGKRAYFGVFYYNHTGSGDRACPTAASVALTPPGARSAVTLSGPGAAIEPFAGPDVSVGCGIVRLTMVSSKSL